MQFSWDPIPQYPAWVFLMATMFSSLASSASVAEYCKPGLYCGPLQPSQGQIIQNFATLMDIISVKVQNEGRGADSIAKTPQATYALGECHRNLNSTECSSCFKNARECLNSCLPAESGRMHMDGCFLRYDNYSFFTESMNRRCDRNICPLPTANRTKNEDESLKLKFVKQLAEVIMNVTKEGANRKFAVGREKDGNGVFALAQCWETLDELACNDCLAEAGKHILTCAPGDEGRALYTGCYLRYSTHKFYNEDVDVETEDPVESKVVMIVTGVFSAVILVLLVILGAVLSWKKRTASSRKKDNNVGRMPGVADKSGLHFRYELLEMATDSFDPSRKLGQGGAGSVFKGTLPTGRMVAVKRLFFNTRQWADEFFNEVNLISGIKHKNLVRLLGCSIEGPESLLIYEFVPNGSLDQIMFGKETMKILTWQQRFQTICGIAEGLAYLHRGSGTKIIHRDIKPSNILLDENLNPKISDFGLARCIAADKSHLSTGIAGTLGYMAPEYLMRGQLTEKADVYAFGVLVVEIVCGKKNSIFTQPSASVLHHVWKNYKGGNITASIDPALLREFSKEEASIALRVVLLCTQSSAGLRPSMSEVVQMLTNKEYTIPSPKQPPFLNATVISPDDRTQTSLMSSWFSNGQASENGSFRSTRSSTSSEHSAMEDFFSSVGHFSVTSIPDVNITAAIGGPEPR